MEWWENDVNQCYKCTDPNQRKPYTDTKDAAYPPHVLIKY